VGLNLNDDDDDDNMGKFGETRGGVEKSGVLEHKSGNISECA